MTRFISQAEFDNPTEDAPAHSGVRFITPQEHAAKFKRPPAEPEPEKPLGWTAPVTELGKSLVREGARTVQTIGGSLPEMAGAGYAAQEDVLRKFPAAIGPGAVPPPNFDYQAAARKVEQSPTPNPMAGQTEAAEAFYGGVVNAPAIQPDKRIANTTYLGSDPFFNKLTKLGSDVGGVVPSLGAAIGGFAVGGPVGAGVVGGGLEASSWYDEAKKSGVPEKEALAGAAIIGGGTSILNALPFLPALQKVVPPKLQGKIANFFVRGLAEGSTETAEGGLTPFAELASGQRAVRTPEEAVTFLQDIAGGVYDESGVFLPAAISGGLIPGGSTQARRPPTPLQQEARQLLLEYKGTAPAQLESRTGQPAPQLGFRGQFNPDGSPITPGDNRNAVPLSEQPLPDPRNQPMTRADLDDFMDGLASYIQSRKSLQVEPMGAQPRQAIPAGARKPELTMPYLVRKPGDAPVEQAQGGMSMPYAQYGSPAIAPTPEAFEPRGGGGGYVMPPREGYREFEQPEFPVDFNRPDFRTLGQPPQPPTAPVIPPQRPVGPQTPPEAAPVAPEAERGAETPVAEFAGWQERPRGQAPIALYNIPEGTGKSTVTAETARQRGFNVPEPPEAAASPDIAAEVRRIEDSLPRQERNTVPKEERPDLNSRQRQDLARQEYINSLNDEQRNALSRLPQLRSQLEADTSLAERKKRTDERRAWAGNQEIAKQIEDELKSKGVAYSRQDAYGGSIYFDVGDKKVRVADHEAPVGGGFSQERQQRMGEADIDINPHSGIGWRDALKQITPPPILEDRPELQAMLDKAQATQGPDPAMVARILGEPAPQAPPQLPAPAPQADTPAAPQGATQAEQKGAPPRDLYEAIGRRLELADLWDTRSRETAGSSGSGVGAGNIDYRWRADAIRGVVRRVSQGKDPQTAAEEQKAEVRGWVSAHNARRNDKDWQRWEGTADRDIDATAKLYSEYPSPQEAATITPDYPESIQYDENETAYQYTQDRLRKAFNLSREDAQLMDVLVSAAGIDPRMLYVAEGSTDDRVTSGVSHSVRMGEKRLRAAILEGRKRSNMQAAAHEMAHAFRYILFDPTLPQEQRGRVTLEDIQIAREWAGAKEDPNTGDWGSDAEERFAQGFEKYVATGEAPNSALARVWDRLRHWITQTYSRLISKPYKKRYDAIQITPEIQGVFDRMMGKQEVAKAKLEQRREARTKQVPVSSTSESNMEWAKTDPKYKVGDKYRVTIAGRTYTEIPVKVFDNGNVILDIFGEKTFKPGQYEKINDVSKRYVSEAPAQPPAAKPPKPGLKERKNAKDRVDKHGLTKDQMSYLTSEIRAKWDTLPINTRWGKQDTDNTAIIKVPGDGTFVINSQEAANAIHKRLTGKWIDEASGIEYKQEKAEELREEIKKWVKWKPYPESRDTSKPVAPDQKGAPNIPTIQKEEIIPEYGRATGLNPYEAMKRQQEQEKAFTETENTAKDKAIRESLGIPDEPLAIYPGPNGMFAVRSEELHPRGAGDELYRTREEAERRVEELRSGRGGRIGSRKPDPQAQTETVEQPPAAPNTERDDEVRALISAAGGIQNLDGPRNAITRQRIMFLLTGEKVPKAKSGINAVRGLLTQKLALEGETISQRQNQINAWATPPAAVAAQPAAEAEPVAPPRETFAERDTRIKQEARSARAIEDTDRHLPLLEQQIEKAIREDSNPERRASIARSIMVGIHPDAQDALARRLWEIDPEAAERAQRSEFIPGKGPFSVSKPDSIQPQEQPANPYDPTPATTPNDAFLELKARFARGEITREQFSEEREKIMEKPARGKGKARKKPTDESGFVNIGAMLELPRRFNDFMKKNPRVIFTKGLGRPLHRGKILMQGMINAQGARAAQNDRDMRKAMKDAYGGKPTEAQWEQVTDVLQGIAPLSSLPQPVQAPVAAMRKHIDLMSRRAVQSGMLTKEQEATFRKNMGTYTTRTYKAFNDPLWARDMPEATRNKFRTYLKQQNPNWTNAQIEQNMFEILEEAKRSGSFLSNIASGGMLGSINQNNLKRRENLSPEYREFLGEERDPSINYLESIMTLANMTAKHRFLTEAARVGLGKFFWRADDPNIPRDVIAIDPNRSPALKPLAGLKAHPALIDAMKEAVDPKSLHGGMALLAQANGMAKLANTAGSWVTQVRNYSSNVIIAIENGHFLGEGAMDDLVLAHKLALVGLTNGGTKASRDLYNRGTLLHVTQDSNTVGELKDIRRRTQASNALGRWLDANVSPKVRNSYNAVSGMLMDLYQAGDDVFKLYGWLRETRQLMDAGWSRSAAEIEAAQIVRAQQPTYSEIPKTIQWLRRNVLAGPFTGFVTEVPRITANTILRAQYEMRTPGLRAIGLKRMVGLMSATAIPSAIVSSMALSHGMDKEDEDDLAMFYPGFMRNSSAAITSTDPQNGIFSVVDMSYIDPGSTLKEPITAMQRSDDSLEGAKEGAWSLLEPYLAEELFFGAAYRIWDTLRGDAGDTAVWNPEDSPTEKMTKGVGEILSPIEPGTITNIRRGIQSGDMNKELATMATGLRHIEIDIPKSLNIEAARYLSNRRKPYREVRRAERDGNTEDYTEQVRQLKAADERAFNRLSDMAAAAERLMVPREKIVAALKEGGISTRQLNAIMRGEWIEPNLADELPEQSAASY